METHKITGARLYYPGGKKKRLRFTATVTDVNGFKDKLKAKHGVEIIMLEYESKA